MDQCWCNVGLPWRLVSALMACAVDAKVESTQCWFYLSSTLDQTFNQHWVNVLCAIMACTGDVNVPVLIQRWPTVCDVGRTLKQHCLNVCFDGMLIRSNTPMLIYVPPPVCDVFSNIEPPSATWAQHWKNNGSCVLRWHAGFTVDVFFFSSTLD